MVLTIVGVDRNSSTSVLSKRKHFDEGEDRESIGDDHNPCKFSVEWSSLPRTRYIHDPKIAVHLPHIRNKAF